MNDEITVTEGTVEQPQMQNGVMAQLDNINQGTVAIEASRAIAEAQAKLVIAKRFPRDETLAYQKIAETCSRRDLAEKAFYSYSRGGSIVSGPSIRLAEELARCWGNIDYGIKELSQDDGKSEMQAYAWDLETNAMSVQNFTSPHIREVKGKAKRLTSQRDIYEINANMGARRLRARILAIIPAYIVEMAITECRKALAGKSDEPLIDRINNMVVAFAKLGVTKEQIETRLKRKVDTMTVDDLTDYIGIYNSIKEKESKPIDWFCTEEKATDLTNALKEDIANND